MYVISFELVGLILSISLVLVHAFLYDNKERTNWMFHYYTMCAAFEAALDILTAGGIEGRIHLSDTANIWLNTIYIIVAMITGCFGYGMVAVRINHSSKVTFGIMVSILGTGILSVLVNVFAGYYFTFENGQYIKTQYFGIIYVFSFLFLALVPVILGVNRKRLTLRERVAPYAFILLLVVTFTIQLLLPNCLLTGFGKALASMVFCLILETPEYIKIRLAVDSLRKAQKEELQALADLEQANIQETEFLISMSHEFRTPINAIMGFDEIILEKSDDPIIRQQAFDLRSSGERLLDLVNEIVDFSQIEMGELELRPREYEFGYAYNYMHIRFRKSGLKFSYNISENIPQRLYGDPKRLCQVLEKLLIYLGKEKSDGHITLNVEVDHLEDNQVYILFTFRNVGGTKSVLNGANESSLAIVEKILEAMGSKLEIQLEEDGEKEFQFILQQEIVDMKSVGNVRNAVKYYLEHEEEEESRDHFVMPKARILVVDDTPVNLRIFQGLISSYKVQVTLAESGKEALRLLKEKEFDLVYMDILMPEMDGVQTLRRIQFDENIMSKNVPVIALTANVFKGAKEKYLQEGFADYITKPVTRESLGESLLMFLADLRETDWAKLDVTKEQEPQKDLKKYKSFLGGAKKKEVVEKQPKEKVLEKKEISFDDIPGLAVQDGLSMCMGDMNLYKDVIRDYCMNQVSDKFEGYLEQEDWENYRILIHGVKSSSKTVGLNELYAGALDLEEAAKREDFDYIRENHKKWSATYCEVTSLLQKLI